MPNDLILSVSGATAIIKDRLDDLPRMTVEGEVSNLRPPNASGHLYFTLGDAGARLNVTFFAFRQKAQGAVPPFANGDKVRVTGRIALYAPHGSYQLNAERLERADGPGELLQRFEALKRKLYAEGLCDPARKRPLPRLPQRIGIVTAPTGAAIRDILTILGRRRPNLHILLAPCRVQGPEAASEIAHAIALLNRRQLTPKDFIVDPTHAHRLTDNARKTLLTTWQERKKTTLIHPYTHETIPLGLIPFTQATLLARHLRGDLEDYPPFIWR